MIPYPKSLRPLVLALLLTGLAPGFNAGPAFAQDVQVGPFTLPPGETVTIEFEAGIKNPFPADKSSVSNQGQYGTVSTDDPDTPAAGDATVTPVVRDADVSIAKTGDPQVFTGGTIMYTLMVSNGGPDAAPNVVVEDTLPAGVTFVSATSPECDGNSSPGKVICILTSLARSATVNLTIQVTANTPGTQSNKVTVTSDATNDPVSTNNSAQFDTTVDEPPTTTTTVPTTTTTVPTTTTTVPTTTTTVPTTTTTVPTTTTTVPTTTTTVPTTTTTVPTTTTTVPTTTTTVPPVTCNGFGPTTGCTVNGVRNQSCRGTPGNDTITGTNGNDVIVGLGGSDIINGGNSDDRICGGDGNDTLNGENGNDRLFGQNGNDALNGNNGNDALDGGAQTDTCNGGNGSDTAASCESLTGVP